MIRWLLIIIAVAGIALATVFVFDSYVLRLTTIIAAICLCLWLSEIVPPFVPTFLLFALIPLLLGPFDKKFSLPSVLNWSMDPVIALFFGGFVLGVAAEAHGFDKRLANIALRLAGRSYTGFLLLIILLTAFLSMWMSNIAAAVLMLACLHPVLLNFDIDNILRRCLLVGVALGANIGGISTPVGTGPNAIAIASISETTHISFLGWMGFALPLSLGMLAVGFALLWFRIRGQKDEWTSRACQLNNKSSCGKDLKIGKQGEYAFLLVFAGTILLWSTEALHGVSASVVSLCSASILFLTRLLKKEHLFCVDWSTLLLIAGGITLGKLLEQSGLITTLAANVAWSEYNTTFALLLLCLASAMLSALMSNTATAVMLIPLAVMIVPGPSTAILVAIAASFGMPFVISTPPNAMVFGKGGVKFGDLFWPGLLIMILGCALISLTGKQLLNLAGIP
ncbi:MAG: DASS family sodium-coupled anion symporter [Chloracidobacterium sp.]|nr:DASS family sodium-coupled anion symporter [Chloracidobacterium sp.]